MKLNCVLMIDDDKICNYLHEKIIRRLNITNEIKIAVNGNEALTTIEEYITKKKEIPQLILLDLKMPVMDGFEFLKIFQESIAKTLYHTKIIILTTSGHPNDIRKISRIGKVTFFTKPLTEEKLNYIYTEYFQKKENSLTETNNEPLQK